MLSCFSSVQLLQPSGLIPPYFSVHGLFLVRILSGLGHALHQRTFPNPGDPMQVLPASPPLHADLTTNQQGFSRVYLWTKYNLGNYELLELEPINLELYVNIKNWFNKLRWVGFFSWKRAILLKVWQLYRHREEEEKASYIKKYNSQWPQDTKKQ